MSKREEAMEILKSLGLPRAAAERALLSDARGAGRVVREDAVGEDAATAAAHLGHYGVDEREVWQRVCSQQPGNSPPPDRPPVRAGSAY